MLNHVGKNKNTKPSLMPASGRKIILQFSASLIAILLITTIIWLATGSDESDMQTQTMTQDNPGSTTTLTNKTMATSVTDTTLTDLPDAGSTSLTDTTSTDMPDAGSASSTDTTLTDMSDAGSVSVTETASTTVSDTSLASVAETALANETSNTSVPISTTATVSGAEAIDTDTQNTRPASTEPKVSSASDDARWPEGFSFQPITLTLAERMRQGGSLTDDTPAALTDLSYLQIPYYDFDGNRQTGEMVVHRLLAEEVLDIFTELYLARFPIASMRLVDDFNADDHASMAANNSYAFCTRPILGSSTGFSRHSYGIAIDINPLQNPYIRDGQIFPAAGEAYQDRNHIRPGMIIPGQLIHESFTSRGWTWGGSWNTLKDYHHFEKDLP